MGTFVRTIFLYMQFNHIALSVSDLQRSVSFYRQHFGFLPDGQFTKPSGLKFCFIKRDTIRLELFECKDSKRPNDDRNDLRIIGLRHLAFRVDDLNREVEKLKQAGLEFNRVEQGTSCKSFSFTSDPDGIAIELYEDN